MEDYRQYLSFSFRLRAAPVVGIGTMTGEHIR